LILSWVIPKTLKMVSAAYRETVSGLYVGERKIISALAL